MPPRIRTIKPEFPQSESMGRVSRDARLAFIMLWTLADDSGRLRGNSRMLASLLFPYDDDAPKCIDRWLNELEKEHCIVRYSVDGDAYIEIRNWLQHQKIDKPSQSKIIAFANVRESSANSREHSSLDQDQDQDQDQEGKGSEYCSEPEVPASEPTIGEPWLCVGKVKTWTMPKSLFDALRVAYPGIDLVSELRKAKAWIVANKRKRKTANGMPRFVYWWCDTAQNKASQKNANNQTIEEVYGNLADNIAKQRGTANAHT